MVAIKQAPLNPTSKGGNRQYLGCASLICAYKTVNREATKKSPPYPICIEF
ncbi:30S ribosomal protein S12 [Marinomonas sp. MED121]|nr:30S ribosomal protein S12 [Marinomonas sp. MED121]